MRKVVALALAMLTLLTLLSLPVAAAETTKGEGTYGLDWVLYGDLDADNTINAKDALSVLKYSVGKQLFSEAEIEIADVNDDAKVDAKDALDILKYSVSKIFEFKAGVFYQISVKEPEQPIEPDDPVEPSNDFIAQYNKSNSVNGAYGKDTTADTSFELDLSDLKANTIYKFASGAWSDRSGIADKEDLERLYFSLQGLVNRSFGLDKNHTTLIYVTGGTDDTNWLKEMQKSGSIMAAASDTAAGLDNVNVRTWDKFWEYFGETVKKAGIILWDGNVPATSNVAATICGLDGYLPVLKDSPLHKTLVAKGVPVKMDLSGMFKNGQSGNITGTSVKSTGSAKNDAYLWALEKYYNRCSAKYIAYTLDGACTIKGYSAYEDNAIALLGDAGSHCLSNHDYLIARRCFFFDLDPYKYQKACDDPAQAAGQAAQGTDQATMIKIFERRYQRGNGEFAALMGFIPWWLKYTDHHGHSVKAGTWLEWMFCETLSCYNLAKEADAAHPCSMYNGSFMYKYVPNTKQYTNNKKAENISYDPNTYYYAVYVGDYDSSAWLKQHINNMWIKKDRNLGAVTMMWSINPNLSERIPVVFDYMYENMSDKDYFAGGDGGAGYIVPEALFTGRTMVYSGLQRPASYGNADVKFANYSKPFYDRFGMDMTGFIINSDHRTLTKEVANAIAMYSPKLNFTTCYNNPVAKYGSTYFVYCQNDLNKSAATNGGNNATMYNYIGHFMKGYNFGAYRTICWTPTEVKACTESFQEYMAGKGKNVKYCDPYTYLNMLKAANNAQVLG